MKFEWPQQFAAQKSASIYNHPAETRIVEKAGEYVYSSTEDYYYGKECGLIKI